MCVRACRLSCSDGVAILDGSLLSLQSLVREISFSSVGFAVPKRIRFRGGSHMDCEQANDKKRAARSKERERDSIACSLESERNMHDWRRWPRGILERVLRHLLSLRTHETTRVKNACRNNDIAGSETTWCQVNLINDGGKNLDARRGMRAIVVVRGMPCIVRAMLHACCSGVIVSKDTLGPNRASQYGMQQAIALVGTFGQRAALATVTKLSWRTNELELIQSVLSAKVAAN